MDGRRHRRIATGNLLILEPVEIFVHEESDDDGARRAGRNFDKLTSYLEETEAGQVEKYEALKVAVREPFGGENIECRDNDPENDKTEKYSGAAEIHVELQNLADSYARGRFESNPGEAGDQQTASGTDRLIRPQGARN